MSPTPLQIKVNAFKRLKKEADSYEREVKENEESFEQLKANGSDEYTLKKHSLILDESKRMVQEVAKKLEEHKEALSQFIDGFNGEEDLGEAKQLLNN